MKMQKTDFYFFLQLLPSYMLYMGPSIDYNLNVIDLVIFECTVFYCGMVGINS